MIGRRAEVGPILLAWTDASAPGDLSTAVMDRLGEAQRRRHAALSGLRARRFLLGRHLLMELASELAPAADLRLTTTCDRCAEEHGRPRLDSAPVAVSVSYAGNIVAVAAARHADAAAVGVDIEDEPPSGRHDPLRALDRLFAPSAPPDTERWTLIEAALKADARGVGVDVAAVQIGAAAPGRFIEVHVPGRRDALLAAVVPGPSGFVLSAAMVPAAGVRHRQSISPRRSAKAAAAATAEDPATRA